MAARQMVLVTVATADDLDDLEQALGSGELEAVVVDIPEDALALQSAREFRRIVDAALGAGVDLQILTDDPLRRELTRILGLRLAPQHGPAAPVADSAPSDDEDAAGDATRRITRPTESEDDTARSVSIHIGQSDIDAATNTLPRTHEPTHESEPSFSFVITPPGNERFHSGRDHLAAEIVADMSHSGEWRIQDLPPIRVPSARRMRASRRLAMLSVFLTLTLSAGLFTAILLPAATVTLAPVEEPIRSELTYGVAQPDKQYDITIQPEPITTTLTFTASIPATGERFVPDGAARGTVLLTNASTSEIAVAAGTTLIAENGNAYTITDTITVPASDPFGTLTFGSIEAAVVAAAPGPGGNLDAGLLYGQLDSGVFYLNRDTIAGGTSRRIATVSQADIDALSQRATEDLERQAAGAVASELKPGQKLLGGSEQREAVEMTFDNEAGADAESVRVDARLVVTAQAYSLDAVHEQARELIGERLREQAGSHRLILDDSLRIGQPEEVAGSGGTAFTVHAAANTRTLIPAAHLDALATDLAGLDHDEALARIRQAPGVGEVQIASSPGWFGERMPRLSSRIEIRVIDGNSASAQTTPSGP